MVRSSKTCAAVRGGAAATSAWALAESSIIERLSGLASRTLVGGLPALCAPLSRAGSYRFCHPYKFVTITWVYNFEIRAQALHGPHTPRPPP